MDGILIIDKPVGITSHDVVASVRRVLKTKRVGHTGTLDPFATGVLVLLIGKATRLARFLDKDEKSYQALIKFGSETDTGDPTGKELQRKGRDHTVQALKDADWDGILSGFRGPILQTPPMFSAKKIGGKKLYEHARKGLEVERKPVNVKIFDLRIYADDTLSPLERRLDVTCSAGTYIRTLAVDIGKSVGTGAHLTALRRTRAGRFDIISAVTLPKLEAAADAASFLLPVETAVEHLPSIMLSADRAARTRNGLPTRAAGQPLAAGEAVQMLDEANELVAVGYFDEDEGTVQPKVVLA